MNNFNTLSINQLSIINGGRKHRRNWARCALGVYGGAGSGGLAGAYFGPWGSAAGASFGGATAAAAYCF